MAEQQKTTIPALDSSGSHKASRDSHPSPTNSTFPFLNLPREIRYQIYKWVVGNRTLHVRHGTYRSGRDALSRGVRLHCYTCRAQSPHLDVYESFAKPVIPEGKTGSTLHKEEPSLDFAHACRCLIWERAKYSIDLLSVSRETAKEAQRLFYSSNTWHFNDVDVFRAWLAVIPPEKLALVHRLILLIRLGKHMSDPGSNVVRWKNILSDQVTTRLPNLKVLHLELLVARFVLEPIIPSPPDGTFCRQANGKEVAELLQPLQRLKKLEDCTVVMKEEEYFLAPYRDNAYWEGQDEDQKQAFWVQ